MRTCSRRGRPSSRQPAALPIPHRQTYPASRAGYQHPDDRGSVGCTSAFLSGRFVDLVPERNPCSEPPWGVEPQTYALRDPRWTVRCRSTCLRPGLMRSRGGRGDVVNELELRRELRRAAGPRGRDPVLARRARWPDRQGSGGAATGSGTATHPRYRPGQPLPALVAGSGGAPHIPKTAPGGHPRGLHAATATSGTGEDSGHNTQMSGWATAGAGRRTGRHRDPVEGVSQRAEMSGEPLGRRGWGDGPRPGGWRGGVERFPWSSRILGSMLRSL
jgi:hypothetical protein